MIEALPWPVRIEMRAFPSPRRAPSIHCGGPSSSRPSAHFKLDSRLALLVVNRTLGVDHGIHDHLRTIARDQLDLTREIGQAKYLP